MLQFKDTEIIKNITLFYENDSTPIFGLIKFLKSINLNKELPTPNQSEYSRTYGFIHLILYCFLGHQNINQYKTGVFSKYIESGKDVFYRTCMNPSIDWRNLVYKINKKLLRNMADDNTQTKSPTCFIIDDTDLEKRGRKIEFIGRIWSHVFNKSILGFKSLNLCYWTGGSLLALDFSLHLELGKNKSRPQGMKPKYIKERYRKKRPVKSPGAKRAKELTASKIERAIQMVKKALNNGITARYLLVDSWFCCETIIRFVHSLVNTDLICRAKMGKSKYLFRGENMSAKELLARFKYRKGVKKYSRKLKTNYLLLKAGFKGIPLQLLFVQTGRNKWILIVTTDRKASVVKIVETYQIRWTIEVFFKQAKQLLGLGKCQANDFDAQIANTSFSIIRYNLLSTIKSKSENFSIGTLFRSIGQSIPNPNIVDRIIKLFYKVQRIISHVFEIDVEELISKLLSLTQLSNFDKQLLAVFCKFETCET